LRGVWNARSGLYDGGGDTRGEGKSKRQTGEFSDFGKKSVRSSSPAFKSMMTKMKRTMMAPP